MKIEALSLYSGALALALGSSVCGEEKADYKAEQLKAAASSPTVLNEWLRQESAVFDAWDFGAQFRARYETKEDGGSLFPSR